MKNLQILLILFVMALTANPNYAQVDECVTHILPFNPEVIRGEEYTPTLGAPPKGPTTKENKIRKIYWLHGMTGVDGSWAAASTFTNLNWGQYMTPRHLRYTDVQHSVPLAANHVYSQLDVAIHKGSDPELEEELWDDYIIAHSMGGVVGRRVEKFILDNGRAHPYGGLVTFGSPHAGSRLAEIKVNNPERISAFLTTSCKELLAGPTKQFVESSNLARIIDRIFYWSKGLDESILEKVCDLVGPLGLSLLDSKMSVPIEKSIVPGNPDLLEIANVPAYDSDLNTVAFYGEEFDFDDMAHRFLFSVNKDVNDYPLMGADVMDDEALKESNDLRVAYNKRFEMWRDRARANPLGICKYFIAGKCWGGYTSQAELYNTAKKWRDGRDWFDKLNNRWKYLMGGLQVQIGGTDCYCSCMETDENGFMVDVLHPVACDPSEECLGYMNGPFFSFCAYVEVTGFILEQLASDGLVTANSAKALPNAKYPSVKMEGSGHFQMRNDSELEKALRTLYGGDIDLYFKLGE
jgi:hypothetical protein